MRNSRMRAITTRYNGYAFRSRLEARWAVFFDHLGVRWEYEPEGFELGNGLRYLPDFWLPDWGMWVEVKPDEPDAVTREKACRLAELVRQPVYVTQGMPDRNGTIFAPVGSKVIELPAYAYFTAEPGHGVVLSFGDDHALPLASYIHTRVDCMPYDRERAKQGVRPRPDRFQDALHTARAARFEFGARGAE